MTYRSSARKSVRVVRRQRGAKRLQSIATRQRVCGSTEAEVVRSNRLIPSWCDLRRQTLRHTAACASRLAACDRAIRRNRRSRCAFTTTTIVLADISTARRQPRARCPGGQCAGGKRNRDDVVASGEPEPLTVPAITWSPGALCTGLDSPVSIDLLMSLDPSRTTPSAGALAPGPTRTRSPGERNPRLEFPCMRGQSNMLPRSPRCDVLAGANRYRLAVQELRQRVGHEEPADRFRWRRSLLPG
jgi:hypothetical protein